MKILHILFTLCGLTWLIGCTPKPKMPKLSLSFTAVDSTDTLARLSFWGAGREREDSLLFYSADSIYLYPDTAGIRHLVVTHGHDSLMQYYELTQGQWRVVAPPKYISGQTPKSVPPIYGLDAKGKSHDIGELIKGGYTVVVFSSLDLRTHTRAERDSLRKQYGGDSLRLIYMMLSHSDSASLARIRRDTLSGIVYSDTLSLVTLMRQAYGIDRAASPQQFLIDSLGKVSTL
ncbi:MAG: hypothetical protein Q4A64_08395 [Porphyromonadaceae bacterium]|nr:hypothetical protein [Porphyromonadaceae bacterium]